jgi:hypothetical protein
MVILGVDSGVSGALAAVTVSGQILWTDHMPTITHTSPRGKRTRLVDVDGLKAAIVAYSPAHAVIEAAASRPNQGVAGVFAYGRAYGFERAMDNLGAIGFTVPDPGFEDPAAWRIDGTGGPIVAALDVFEPDRPERIFATVRDLYRTG